MFLSKCPEIFNHLLQSVISGLVLDCLSILRLRTTESLLFPESLTSSLETVLRDVSFFKAVNQTADLTSLWNIQSLLTVIAFSGQTFWHAKQYTQKSSETLGLPFSSSTTACAGQISTQTLHPWGQRSAFNWTVPRKGFLTTIALKGQADSHRLQYIQSDSSTCKSTICALLFEPLVRTSIAPVGHSSWHLSLHSDLHFSLLTLISFSKTGKASFFTIVAISSPSISIFSASKGHMVAHSPQKIQESILKSIVGFFAKRPSTSLGGFQLIASFGQFSAHIPQPSHKSVFKQSTYSLVSKLRFNCI